MSNPRFFEKKRLLPYAIEEEICQLFKQDSFLDDSALIIRDFLIATWKMQISPYEMNIVQIALLMNPIADLVLQKINSQKKNEINKG